MINVGYEFDVDKKKWKTYVNDYLIGESSFNYSSRDLSSDF
jgi:hypothetical protein